MVSACMPCVRLSKKETYFFCSKLSRGGMRGRVDVTTFHTQPDAQIETVMAVRSAEIGEPPYPNWTAVSVNWLAGFDFEIKVIARIPGAI